MSDVQLELTPDEVHLVASACLTYLGVPFHRVEQTRTAPSDLEQIERLLQSFIDRPDHPPSANADHVHVLSVTESDLQLLIDVTNEVLVEREPPDEHSDFDLQLHVGPRPDVMKTLNKLRQVQEHLQVA